MVAYKTFYERLRGVFKETTDAQGMERLRQTAQCFINQEIGAEQVLTIAA